MGNLLQKEQPPPVVLVPPLFDFPPLAARTRMLVPAYDFLLGKLARRCLFEEYFEKAGNFTTSILLKPIDDSHVDLVATVSGPFDPKSGGNVSGDAIFRWQRDVDDPNTFMDLYMSSSEQILRMRSCAYYPKHGMGMFTILPLLLKKRTCPEDYGVIGLRYGSGQLSIGTTFTPFSASAEFPNCAWAVGRAGKLTAGIQYKPLIGSTSREKLNNLINWSCAIGYGLGLTSPLSPSFSFGLELVKGSQLITSFYQHAVVQRRVKNPFEEDEVVAITNYIDFGFELATRIQEANAPNNTESTFQMAASWQANKNFLIKGKLGPLSSSIALAFKSWWKPAFSFSISAVKDRAAGKTSFGFGIRVENLREASYERADANYVMLTPTKEHLAGDIIQVIGKRPMLQSDIAGGNFDKLPRDLRPIGKVL
ncbi:uncharacterized protein LOC116259913 [Nymphaea colorata]|nr:uncharacterized protein LOC116259913 [Nymphaea colorata]